MAISTGNCSYMSFDLYSSKCSCNPKPELFYALQTCPWLIKDVWTLVFEFCDFDWFDQRVRDVGWRGNSYTDWICCRWGNKVRLEKWTYPPFGSPYLTFTDDHMYCWHIICQHDVLHPRLDKQMAETGFKVRHTFQCALNHRALPADQERVLCDWKQVSPPQKRVVTELIAFPLIIL